MKNGWIRRNLGEITTKIGSGATPKGGRASYKLSGISLIRSLNVHDSEFRMKDLAFIDEDQARQLDNVVVAAGDVLLNITGASVARCCVVPDEVIPARVNQHVSILRPDAQHLLPRFLQYMLVSSDYKRQLLSAGEAGATRQALTKGLLEGFPIKFPESLPEQRRIVGILDEAFAGIATAKANAEKNLQNARALFESHLNAVFTQRDSSHVEKRLIDVCDRITVGHVGSMAKKYKETGIPFLRSQNVRPFEISLDNIVYIDDAFNRRLGKSQLKPGDVAVVRTGYPGTAAVIPESLPVSNCSDLVIVRPGPDADPYYLAVFFNSSLGKQLVAGRLVGAAQKHFNVTAAKQVAISFPPVAEQRRLVAKIEAFGTETQRLESIYQRKLAALDELKKSLLHQAFSGKL